MSGPRVFVSGVDRSNAVLTEPPGFWSYSSLNEVETCPRRYVLSRSSYPDLWGGSGYPEVPNQAALFGDVVHDSLEEVVKALAEHGCDSATGSKAIAVLRELGGYSEVARRMLARRLAQLDGNPRLSDEDRVRLQDRLEHRIPEVREEVQHYLHRMTLTPTEREHSAIPAASRGNRRRQRGVGSHPEATLQADELRLRGRIDLLDVGEDKVNITDYKTGAEAESHLDQLRLYAVLWNQDRVSNDKDTPLGTLTAAYPTRVVTIDAPDPAELQALAGHLAQRVGEADARVMSDLPAAQTGEHCSFCSVRPLCSAYWESAPDATSLSDGAWFDFEGTVLERNGVKSWWLMGMTPEPVHLLLRTTSAHQEFEPGQHVRLLGIRRDEDPETNAVVAVLTQTSETFLVVGESDY